MPATSQPGLNGSSGRCWYFPWTIRMSGKLQPIARTSMITSPAFGRGMGTSAYSSVDGSPHARASIVFIGFPSGRRIVARAGKMIAVSDSPGPLDSVRVLDLATYLAAPVCATLLGEFGAEVIKVEQPRVGDDLRRLGRAAGPDAGGSYWWFVESRNKKSITCNLRDPEGQALIRRLVTESHVLAENFRPGTLERWNLGGEALSGCGPRVAFLRDRPERRAARLRAHRRRGRRPLVPLRLPGSPARAARNTDRPRLSRRSPPCGACPRRT